MTLTANGFVTLKLQRKLNWKPSRSRDISQKPLASVGSNGSISSKLSSMRLATRGRASLGEPGIGVTR